MLSQEIRELVIKAYPQKRQDVRQAVEQDPDLALKCLLESVGWDAQIRSGDVYNSLLDAGNSLLRKVKQANGQDQQTASETAGNE